MDRTFAKMIEPFLIDYPGLRYDNDGFPTERTDLGSDTLPYEEPDMINFEPLSFEEMAESLTQSVSKLNSAACVINRFSQDYLDISRKLEHSIADLASCCVTRAAFEKQDVHFEHLDDLNITWLYCLVSAHFRKCHDAAVRTNIKNQKFWAELVEMEFHWYNMARRLQASADRIEDIKSGKVNIEKLIEKKESSWFRPKKKDAEKQDADEPKPLGTAKARSYPILGEFLRSEPGQINEGIAESKDSDTLPVSAEDQETPEQNTAIEQQKKPKRFVRGHAEPNTRQSTADQTQQSAASEEQEYEKYPEFLTAEDFDRLEKDVLESIQYADSNEEAILITGPPPVRV